MLGDGGGDRVDLDADHSRPWWCGAQEHAGAAPGLQDGASAQAEVGQGLPHGRGVGVVCVVRVDGGPLGGPVFGRGQQLAQLLAFGRELGPGLIEDLRDCAPGAPPGQDLLFCGHGRAGLVVQVAQQP